MSQQGIVWSFFEKPENCDSVDEQGEKWETGALEEQATADNMWPERTWWMDQVRRKQKSVKRHDGKFCGIALIQANTQPFLIILYTEQAISWRKINQKRFPLKHMVIIADLHSGLNTSHYLDADSMLNSWGLDGGVQLCQLLNYENEWKQKL